MDIAVQVEHIKFQYPGQNNICLSDVSLSIQQGEKFGLFGPNGAGKTTLMSLMTGLVPIQEGTIHMLGKALNPKKKAQNSQFGFVPQDFSFYHELSPKENLAFFGAWYGLNSTQIKERTGNLLDILGLSDVIHKPVGLFSGGMKRRVNLAIGVMHQPQVLFLDEPTVGVDVQTRHAIISYLLELNKTGTTLIYTSHQLNEAEALCDKVALIDEGKIIVHDTLQNLMVTHQQDGLEGLFLNLTGKAYRD